MSGKVFLEYIFRGTDCTFIFPSDDVECVEIHANRHVIDVASPYLKAKFETYKRNTLVIQDVKCSTFKLVLEHVYTGCLPESITQQLLFQMYDCAEKYEFKETMHSVIRHMLKECKLERLEELLSYLNFALKHYIVEIQNSLKELIECNADLILVSEKFINAHPRVFNWVFSLNDLNIDEWTLVDIAEKYKAFHVTAGRHGISSQIQPAINNIRFLSMTAKQVCKATFLSAEEKNCLIQVINQEASDKSVPMYFSRRRIGRCHKSIKIFCDDSRFKKLYEDNKIKMCTFKERKYFADEDGKIVACIENNGCVAPCQFQELTPVKEEIHGGRTKKACTGITQNVLYYKENKQIMVNKKILRDYGEKDKNEDEATISFSKLSLKKI